MVLKIGIIAQVNLKPIGSFSLVMLLRHQMKPLTRLSITLDIYFELHLARERQCYSRLVSELYFKHFIIEGTTHFLHHIVLSAKRTKTVYISVKNKPFPKIKTFFFMDYLHP